ncbi:MAG: NADH-quinone oxidoreductase subunit NuoK [Armatimonadota bacterium]
MTSVSAGGLLSVAAALLIIGMVGVMVRRDLLYVLMSLEIMINAAALAFIVAAARWGQPDGQVMVVLILVAAAAEVGVGLSLVLRLYHRFATVDGDQISSLKG